MANSSMLVLPTMTAPAVAQAGDDGGVIGRHEALQNARAAGGAHALGAQDVLDGHGNAGERAALAGGQHGVGLLCAWARAISGVRVMKALTLSSTAASRLENGLVSSTADMLAAGQQTHVLPEWSELWILHSFPLQDVSDRGPRRLATLLVQRVAFLDALAAALAPGRAGNRDRCNRVSRARRSCAWQALGIDDDARPAQRLAVAAHIGGDGGRAAGHGLEHRQRQSLDAGRQDEDVGGAQDVDALLPARVMTPVKMMRSSPR